MRKRVELLDTRVQGDLQRVLQMQAKARREKDVIKLNCVNDKLVQLKAEMNIFDRQHAQLEVALTDALDTRHGFFVDVSASVENIRKRRSEAEVCIGEPEMFKQESKTDSQHPNFPDDPTQGPFDDGGSIEPPSYASPYK